jgi:hypothetical protein
MTRRRYERLKEELAAKGRLPCTIVSGSMLPVIPIGGEVEIAPLRGTPRLFDIVVFWKTDRLICHYVCHVNRLREEDPVLVTRGLASGHEDIPIRRSAVLGRVVSHRIPAKARWSALAARAWAAIRRR